MDILSLTPNTITVDLKHPGSDQPIGVKVELQSLESDEVKAVERSLKNRALKSGRNNVTAEKIDDNTVAILSAAIVGWEFADGASLGDDKKPACNAANKRKLLQVPALAKQIDNALGNEAAFFEKSATS
jgi:hypothetical protein